MLALAGFVRLMRPLGCSIVRSIFKAGVVFPDLVLLDFLRIIVLCGVLNVFAPRVTRMVFSIGLSILQQGLVSVSSWLVPFETAINYRLIGCAVLLGKNPSCGKRSSNHYTTFIHFCHEVSRIPYVFR